MRAAPKKIALIAGTGMLPILIRDHLVRTGQAFCILALEENVSSALYTGHPHHKVRMGAVGDILKHLRQESITHLVFAGNVVRPSMKALRPDKTALAWLAKIGFKAFGDDGILSGITQLLEKEGITVVGAHQLLGALKMPEGVLTKYVPTDEEEQDIQKGKAVAEALGALDVGQGVVVQQGLVLAVEAIEGTAAMLARVGGLSREKASGVLIKMCKPQQEERVDLPTIGPDTVDQVIKAGLKGIALSAGRGLLLQQEETVKKANAANIFIVGA